MGTDFSSEQEKGMWISGGTTPPWVGMGTPELPAPSQGAGLVLSYPVSQPG